MERRHSSGKAIDTNEIVSYFDNICRTEDVAVAIAAIRTQLWVLENGPAVSTMTEMRQVLTKGAEAMASTKTSVWSVKSGCELFLRFITYTELDFPDFSECRKVLIERGYKFLERLNISRDRIAANFISILPRKKQTVLLHGRSRIVRYVLEQASQKPWIALSCLVTESQPDLAGRMMCEELRKSGIDSHLILDCAVGYIMERVDLVIFGAEAVLSTGGIVNKIGTLSVAMCAREHSKPVWVMAESFKLMQETPWYQSDLPQRVKGAAYKPWRPGVSLEYQSGESVKNADDVPGSEDEEHPRIDYTKPKYLNYIVTDMGIMNPTAVALEVLKLYL